MREALHKVAVQHLDTHKRTNKQSKALCEGFVEIYDEHLGYMVVNNLTGEVCEHLHCEWMLEGQVLVCMHCGSDCT